MELFRKKVFFYKPFLGIIHVMNKPSAYKISWLTIGVTFVTLILYFVPLLSPLAYPFMLLSTLAHEMGHGLAAVLVGGHFDSFKHRGHDIASTLIIA